MRSEAAALAQRLREALGAAHVEVEDESHLHAGHAGVRERGGRHFRAVIVAEQFEGLSRVAAQRAVFAALDGQFERGIHAFAMKTYTPAQWAQRKG